MTLADYLAERGITNTQFARAIDRADSTVSRLVRGLQRPEWRTMEAIKRETGGAVTPDDFLASGNAA